MSVARIPSGRPSTVTAVRTRAARRPGPRLTRPVPAHLALGQSYARGIPVRTTDV